MSRGRERTARVRRRGGGEGPPGYGVEREEKDHEGAESKRRRRTARVRCREGGEGPRGCGVEEEK
eukprot:3851598-Rhodomonas_salina.1